MNRNQLRERLRNLSGVLMDTLLEDDQAHAYLNEAYFNICSLAEWSFLFSEQNVTTSSDTFGAPGAIGRIQDVVLNDLASDRRLLRRVPLSDLARYPRHRDDGFPWAWANVGATQVRVFPSPSTLTSFTVRGWIDVQPMTSGTSTPTFAAEFHAVVAYEAAANVLEAEGDDSGRSAAYRGEVQAYLARMARRYLPEGGQVAYPPSADGQVETPEVEA